jgi:hypothetical protein
MCRKRALKKLRISGIARISISGAASSGSVYLSSNRFQRLEAAN